MSQTSQTPQTSQIPQIVQERESITKSSLRAFMRALFTVLGIVFAFFLFGLIFSSASSAKDQLPQKFAVKVLPDAEGKRAVLPESGPILLQINLRGVIGIDHLTSHAINDLLVESREGDLEHGRVKGILLSIASPGGTVTDASGIYQALQEYKTRFQVPIIAHVDGLSASGAVMVSCAADKIVATDSSLIGSVGVITPPFFNVSNLMDKLGVASLTIFAGKDKDELNPFRPWSKTESEPIQEIIHYYYDYFVNMVTHSRPNLSKEKLTKEYGAQVFPASIAQEHGFIDATGYSRSDALKLLLAQAKLEGHDYRVVELSDKSWVSELFKSQTRSPLITGIMEHRLQLGAQQHPDLQGQFLYLYRP